MSPRDPTLASLQDRFEPEAGNQGDTRPPDRASLILTEAELESSRLTPDCIVENLLYADVGQLVAPGGTGKTTLLLYILACVTIGRPVFGLPVRKRGWCLLITAEDRRDTLAARLREVMGAMDLSPEERAQVRTGVSIWDVSGKGRRLVVNCDGNIVPTSLPSEIVEAYRTEPPVVVVFDPLVSFGASEQRLNDNEQALIDAGRQIKNGLNACTLFVHHTGQGNARSKSLDQYAGRNGSAMPDGTRMTLVLQPWEQGDERQPPAGIRPGPGSSVMVLARPKVSYAPPRLPHIWIKRTGWTFEHQVEFTASPEERLGAHADQVVRFLESELKRGRRYTARQLEEALERLGMKRSELRGALSELEVSGRIKPAPLPPELCQGSRRQFLCPSHCAEKFGAVADHKEAQP